MSEEDFAKEIKKHLKDDKYFIKPIVKKFGVSKSLVGLHGIELGFFSY